LNEKKMDSSFEKIKSGIGFLNTQSHLADITPFTGAILRKAEFENSFDKVYSRVIEKMTQLEFISSENDNVLEIFGVVGG